VRELRVQEPTIRQILVITDGCSNVGADPVECAARARKQNIVVNVIGVIDKGDLGKQGKAEAMCIAEAGGGLCRLVQASELSATAQMMTHQTMQMTLAQVVNRELMQVMGKTTEELSPQERASVMKVVDKLEEEVGLELVVAVDTSASMKEKMTTVREALRDLALSLQARQGSSEVAVLIFPGNDDEMVKVVQPFTTLVDVKALDRILVARGGTPTGPAIEKAIDLFTERHITESYPEERWTGDGASLS
jgi:Ca-activated chloride channel homolog